MKPYAHNPRTLSEARYERLQANLELHGDLGGIVHDLNSDAICGGHQRLRALFGEDADGFKVSDGEIEFTHQYESPDRQGTVALGYLTLDGTRYNYRQVRWDETQFKAANLAANMDYGMWEFDTLAANWDVPDLIGAGFDEELLKGLGSGYGNLSELLKSEKFLVLGDDDSVDKGDRAGSSPWDRISPSGKIRALIGDIEFGIDESVVSLWLGTLQLMRCASIREAAEEWFTQHIQS